MATPEFTALEHRGGKFKIRFGPAALDWAPATIIQMSLHRRHHQDHHHHYHTCIKHHPPHQDDYQQQASSLLYQHHLNHHQQHQILVRHNHFNVLTSPKPQKTMFIKPASFGESLNKWLNDKSRKRR